VKQEGEPKQEGELKQEGETKHEGGQPVLAPSSETLPSAEAKQARILEKGVIYFFYRPKVGEEHVDDLSQVQRLYILLVPKETETPEEVHHRKHRLIAIAKKKLPDVHTRSRYWGFVDEASEEIENVRKDVDSVTYSTKTRGERKLEAARPAGEGVYAIIEHKGHTHLAYVLEQPEHLGEVQKAFNIEKEGSFIITVKNPAHPLSFGPSEKEELPSHLLGVFRGRKFAPVNPTELLDYKGAEIIIIGASDDLKEEFGELGLELEKDEQEDAKKLSDHKLFDELHLDKKKFLSQPLLQGDWK